VSTTHTMLNTHPADPGSLDQSILVACIDACIDCAQACTLCADACLSEKSVADLTSCIAADADCADICATTGRVLSRRTGAHPDLITMLLEACAAACKACGDECARHASMHAHCKVCADACRRCEKACGELFSALR
jgi:hypothetical protein